VGANFKSSHGGISVEIAQRCPNFSRHPEDPAPTPKNWLPTFPTLSPVRPQVPPENAISGPPAKRAQNRAPAPSSGSGGPLPKKGPKTPRQEPPDPPYQRLIKTAAGKRSFFGGFSGKSFTCLIEGFFGKSRFFRGRPCRNGADFRSFCVLSKKHV